MASNAFYYSNCSTLIIGCFLYTDSTATTLVPDGKYSDKVTCFTVVSGQITATAVC